MVETLLKRVGMTCFINCFTDFEKASKGKLSLEDLIDVMYQRGGAETENSAVTKARNGLKIFQVGSVKQALSAIKASSRVDSQISKTADKLLSSI